MSLRDPVGASTTPGNLSRNDGRALNPSRVILRPLLVILSPSARVILNEVKDLGASRASSAKDLALRMNSIKEFMSTRFFPLQGQNDIEMEELDLLFDLFFWLVVGAFVSLIFAAGAISTLEARHRVVSFNQKPKNFYITSDVVNSNAIQHPILHPLLSLRRERPPLDLEEFFFKYGLSLKEMDEFLISKGFSLNDVERYFLFHRGGSELVTKGLSLNNVESKLVTLDDVLSFLGIPLQEVQAYFDHMLEPEDQLSKLPKPSSRFERGRFPALGLEPQEDGETILKTKLISSNANGRDSFSLFLPMGITAGPDADGSMDFRPIDMESGPIIPSGAVLEETVLVTPNTLPKKTTLPIATNSQVIQFEVNEERVGSGWTNSKGITLNSNGQLDVGNNPSGEEVMITYQIRETENVLKIMNPSIPTKEQRLRLVLEHLDMFPELKEDMNQLKAHGFVFELQGGRLAIAKKVMELVRKYYRYVHDHEMAPFDQGETLMSYSRRLYRKNGFVPMDCDWLARVVQICLTDYGYPLEDVAIAGGILRDPEKTKHTKKAFHGAPFVRKNSFGNEWFYVEATSGVTVVPEKERDKAQLSDSRYFARTVDEAIAAYNEGKTQNWDVAFSDFAKALLDSARSGEERALIAKIMNEMYKDTLPDSKRTEADFLNPKILIGMASQLVPAEWSQKLKEAVEKIEADALAKIWLSENTGSILRNAMFELWSESTDLELLSSALTLPPLRLDLAELHSRIWKQRMSQHPNWQPSYSDEEIANIKHSLASLAHESFLDALQNPENGNDAAAAYDLFFNQLGQEYPLDVEIAWNVAAELGAENLSESLKSAISELNSQAHFRKSSVIPNPSLVILNDPKGLLRGVKDLSSPDSSVTVLADKSASPHPPEDGFVLLAKNDMLSNATQNGIHPDNQSEQESLKLRFLQSMVNGTSVNAKDSLELLGQNDIPEEWTLKLLEESQALTWGEIKTGAESLFKDRPGQKNKTEESVVETWHFQVTPTTPIAEALDQVDWVKRNLLPENQHEIFSRDPILAALAEHVQTKPQALGNNLNLGEYVNTALGEMLGENFNYLKDNTKNLGGWFFAPREAKGILKSVNGDPATRRLLNGVLGNSENPEGKLSSSDLNQLREFLNQPDQRHEMRSPMNRRSEIRTQNDDGQKTIPNLNGVIYAHSRQLMDQLGYLILPQMEDPSEIVNIADVRPDSKVMMIGGALIPFHFLNAAGEVDVVDVNPLQIQFLKGLADSIRTSQVRDKIEEIRGLIENSTLDASSKQVSFLAHVFYYSFIQHHEVELRTKINQNQLNLIQNDLIHFRPEKKYDVVFYGTLPMVLEYSDTHFAEKLAERMVEQLNQGAKVIYASVNLFPLNGAIPFTEQYFPVGTHIQRVKSNTNPDLTYTTAVLKPETGNLKFNPETKQKIESVLNQLIKTWKFNAPIGASLDELLQPGIFGYNPAYEEMRKLLFDLRSAYLSANEQSFKANLGVMANHLNQHRAGSVYYGVNKALSAIEHFNSAHSEVRNTAAQSLQNELSQYLTLQTLASASESTTEAASGIAASLTDARGAEVPLENILAVINRVEEERLSELRGIRTGDIAQSFLSLRGVPGGRRSNPGMEIASASPGMLLRNDEFSINFTQVENLEKSLEGVFQALLHAKGTIRLEFWGEVTESGASELNALFETAVHLASANPDLKIEVTGARALEGIFTKSLGRVRNTAGVLKGKIKPGQILINPAYSTPNMVVTINLEGGRAKRELGVLFFDPRTPVILSPSLVILNEVKDLALRVNSAKDLNSLDSPAVPHHASTLSFADSLLLSASLLGKTSEIAGVRRSASNVFQPVNVEQAHYAAYAFRLLLEGAANKKLQTAA